MAALRDYQEEVVKIARERNVIMVGNTGIGKTFVSIMLLREQDYSLKRAFVMAPTRQLVSQIHSKILKLTSLKVDAYCGRELEVWDKMKWEHEILLNSVFVCTPEILRNLITKGYITMDRINLLIFDECHHVGKRHPYNQIMKLYDPTDKRMPRVFGTTACPTKHCSVNMHAVVKKITLHAHDLAKYAACAPVIHETYEPNVDCHPSTVVDIVSRLLSELDVLDVFSALLSQGKYRHTSTAEKRGKRMTKLLDDCKTIYQNLGPWCMYRFIELEIDKQARSSSVRWTSADSVVGLDVRAVDVLLRCADKRLQTRMACTPKVDKIVSILHDKLFAGRIPLATPETSMAQLHGEQATHQDEADLAAMLEDAVYVDAVDGSDDDDAMSGEEDEDTLQFEPLLPHDHDSGANDSLDTQLKCVIFVNRRAECRALTDYLNAKFVAPAAIGREVDDDDEDVVMQHDNRHDLFGCMLGQASASDAASYDIPDMQSMLQAFESGAVRVLVSTSVSCEGVDFPLCSMVICGDPLTCPRKFIQVRGRARHTDGVCFYLTDVSSVEDGTMFDVLTRQAEEISALKFGCDKQVTLGMEPRSILALAQSREYTIVGLDDGELVAATCSLRKSGAVLDLDSSISALHMFCQSLPDYEKMVLKPSFEFVEARIDKLPMFKAKLTLPAPVGLAAIETGFMRTKTIAKALAAFHACEMLLRQGRLDDNLNSVYRRTKLRDVVLANEIQALHDRQVNKALRKQVRNM
ncbi:hypothetical protein DYB38_009557 [Aphanomyces astaci]|uniref:Helicase ATP-binding domain-containing protein n=1 Tax=Aphanomyces astaci TaxID=112090 RepID=A0A397DSS7_APHAT|nr:hypothetical protein DYB38_009557 [Aphanomyces astaci]